ncbi:MAG: DUF4345 domain-containing protein [Alphaproteobacteria bacterium]|jgi:hypothetical protein|nr:DUF4345 domain-containing protein [Alphaproteobacteria bacterium]
MMPQLILGVATLYAAAQAYLCLARPELVAPVLGLTLDTPLARSEFMTAYGGIYAGIAVFWAAGLVRGTLREGGLAFLALAATGAVLARLWTLVVLPLGVGAVAAVLAAEVVLAVLGWLGWRAEWRRTLRATV